MHTDHGAAPVPILEGQTVSAISCSSDERPGGEDDKPSSCPNILFWICSEAQYSNWVSFLPIFKDKVPPEDGTVKHPAQSLMIPTPALASTSNYNAMPSIRVSYGNG